MRSVVRSAAFFLAIAACGGGKAPAAAVPTSSAAPAPDAAAPGPATKKPSEEAIKASLAPKPGEQPADSAPIPGVAELTPADEALLQKCSAAKEKALERTKKLPFDKQLAAGLKAMEGVSKRCMDIALAKQTAGGARLKDMNAQMEMRALAKALAKSPDTCGTGAQNPATKMGACFMGMDPLLWDRDGWSCVAKSMDEADKSLFSFKASYVYSFTTDASLGTWELVGRGCSMMLGGKGGFAETELVMRGRRGDDVAQTVLYRRDAKPEKDKAEKRPDWANP